jgi:hypothetical protein
VPAHCRSAIGRHLVLFVVDLVSWRIVVSPLKFLDLDVITEVLSDHFSAPASICRHPDTSLLAPKRVISVTAIAIDLNERLLYATDGQICQSGFQRFTLPSRAAASDAA